MRCGERCQWRECTAVDRHAVGVVAERTVVDTISETEGSDLRSAAVEAHAAGEVADIIYCQSGVALLRYLRLAGDSGTGEGVVLSIVVEDDSLRLYGLGNLHIGVRGIVVECHGIAGDEDVGAVGRAEVLLVGKIPFAVDAACPLDAAGIAHLGDDELELSVLVFQ